MLHTVGVGRLLALAAACHQITFIVVESWLFKGLRDAAASRNEHLGKLVSCHLCFGTWVGLVLTLVFRPTLVPPATPRHGVLRSTFAWLLDAFVVSLVARVMNEVIAALRTDVEVKEQEKKLLEEAAEGTEAAARPA